MQIRRDGRGRALDNIVVERLWRTVQYEEGYVKDDETPREAMEGLATCFVRYNEWRQHQALGYRTPATIYYGSTL
jgi:transposase InsO family protein